MGLDWIPIAKPIPGKETEFKTSYEKILASRSDEEAQKVMEFMRTVSINSRSELEVPIVGRDVEASEYLTKVHKERDIQEPLADFIKRHDGFWVWQIAKPSDGIPEFSNSCTYTNVDGSSFRAEFLKDAGRCKKLSVKAVKRGRPRLIFQLQERRTTDGLTR